MVAGIVGAGLNAGILMLSQIARFWHVTPESWRWLFGWSAVPGLLGMASVLFVPESPKWLACRGSRRQEVPSAIRKEQSLLSPATTSKTSSPLGELFRP